MCQCKNKTAAERSVAVGQNSLKGRNKTATGRVHPRPQKLCFEKLFFGQQAHSCSMFFNKFCDVYHKIECASFLRKMNAVYHYLTGMVKEEQRIDLCKV